MSSSDITDADHTQVVNLVEASGSSSSHSHEIKKDENPLNIVIMSQGTRGDTQPFVLLGLALKRRGHNVKVATEERMHSFVESYGLEYAHVEGDPCGVLFTEWGQKMLEEGSLLKIMSKMKDNSQPFYEPSFDNYVQACQGANVIICGAIVMNQAFTIAEKLNIPCIPMVLGQSFPTDEFPSWALSNTPFTFKFMNKLSYSFLFWMLWKTEAGRVNKYRAEKLGLPPAKESPSVPLLAGNAPIISAFNKVLLPNEKVPHDWLPVFTPTGFIFPPPDKEGDIPPGLEEWINTGDKPIYFGFGSMPAADPKKLLKLAVEVTNHLKIRTVLIVGWSGMTDEMLNEIIVDKEKIFPIKAVSHTWLFPKCSVLVHHGGVGTTSAALRSGVPQVVCPIYLDQPYWALRMQQLGVGAQPIPFQKLNAHNLSSALEHILSSKTHAGRAQEIALQIQNDRGTEAAVNIVLKACGRPFEKVVDHPLL
eukprot:TRINITY_DN4330_c0_g1_i1.p1 TRINITY_DN4330_c0_g1~~TRINITY_DN4330_c0_g1_i1.p1  ORF type:complete len:477 (-),score=94.37 TRINITY_DN4330_c0_g1_i1:94-1524(-)